MTETVASGRGEAIDIVIIMHGSLQSGVGKLLLAAALFSEVPAGAERPMATSCLSLSELENLKPAIRERVQKSYQEEQAKPASAEAKGRLGEILEAYEQFHLASVCYQRAAILEPGSFRWAYYLGRLQNSLGKSMEAVAALRKAVELDPDYAPARQKLAEALLAVGEWEDGRKIYERLLRQHPDSAAAHYGLGRTQSAKGELAAAAASYSQACRLWPDFGAAHYALAITYRDLGEKAKSQEHFASFQRNPDGRPPLEDPLMEAINALKSGSDYHLGRAIQFQKAGRFQEAVSEFEEALETDPHSALAHAGLLTTYLNLALTSPNLAPQYLSKAEEHYHAAVKIDPSMCEVHHDYGILLARQGRQREAADAFRTALQINPFYAESHNYLGFLMADEGLLSEAEDHFRLAIENNPNLRAAHFGLGKILQGQGKNTEAIHQFLQTVTVEDENTPRFLYNLADAYARTGSRPKAIQYAEQARRLATSLGQTALVVEIEGLLKGFAGTGASK